MISFSELVSRLGVDGRLAPFFKCVCVYFAVAGGGVGAGALVAATKCAPVLCLLLLVALQAQAALDAPRVRYARWVALGLALSAAGDALLVWPQYFVAGMGAFGLAHVAYVTAFGFERWSWVAGAALYAATGAFLSALSPPAALRLLVPLYSMLLATMAWRATAHNYKAAIGSLLFLISDAFLGYSMFGGTVPYKQVVVMSTYYLGQLGLALSALQPPRA